MTTTGTWMWWLLLFVAAVFYEGFTMGGHGMPLTGVVRVLRFDPVGRFAFLMFWCWLTWHWALRPQQIEGFTWRDVAALVVGLVWAWAEYRRRS